MLNIQLKTLSTIKTTLQPTIIISPVHQGIEIFHYKTAHYMLFQFLRSGELKSFLSLIFILSFCVQLNAKTCNSILSATNNSALLKELQKIKNLNPELVEKFYSNSDQNFNSLYLILKAEGWRVMPHGLIPWKNKPELSEEVLNILRQRQSKVYRTQELSEEELYIFYANAIQARYIFIARQIRTDFINKLFNQPISKTTKDFLSLVYDSLIISDLGRSDVSLESTQEALYLDLTDLIHWQVFMEISEQYSKEADGDEVNGWLNNQKLFLSLTAKEQELLKRHLGKSLNSKKHCCLNKPGCLFCPNNRSFLQKP